MGLVCADGASYWHYIVSNTDELNMNVEFWCNDTNSRKKGAQRISWPFTFCAP